MAKALIPAVVEAELIEGNTVEAALRTLLHKGFVPAYMLEIIDGRNKFSPEEAPGNWEWLTSPSIRATGRTEAGTPVVVYVHDQNYFSSPDNVAQAASQGFVNGAGIIPDGEFYRLVDLAEEQQGRPNQRVFLADYKALKKAPSGLVAVKKALRHPHTIPFLGGQERAEKYLPRYERFLGKEIGIWYVDDLTEQASVGRVLRVGYRSDGLGGGNHFDYGARFVGVRQGAEGAAPQNLEAILKTLDGVVAPFAVGEAIKRLRNAGYR